MNWGIWQATVHGVAKVGHDWSDLVQHTQKLEDLTCVQKLEDFKTSWSSITCKNDEERLKWESTSDWEVEDQEGAEFRSEARCSHLSYSS